MFQLIFSALKQWPFSPAMACLAAPQNYPNALSSRAAPYLEFVMAAFPLLLIPFALLNILMFFVDGGLSQVWLSASLPSGGAFVLTAGDVGAAIGLLFLYFEVLKSTRTGTASILDHVLSLALFVVCLLELLLVARAANSAFFLLTIMTLIDVISGFTVSISVARRDIGFSEPK